jgi:hypothetical protein
MQEPTYKDFFLHDLNFAVEYISLHYPFSERQMRLYMPHLKKGNAYYPIYEKDTNIFNDPELGLCYNKNIFWTDALKEQWQTNAVDGSIPLSIETFFERYNHYMWEWHLSNHDYTEYELMHMEYNHVPHEILHPVTYSHLSPVELFKHRVHNEILYNESIWENTLKGVLDDDFIDMVMRLRGVISPFAGEELIRIDDTYLDDELNDDNEDDDHQKEIDDYFRKERFEKYHGYNGWSDQAIDEAFEGDPEATWNVD